jgi:hypothetical protein
MEYRYSYIVNPSRYESKGLNGNLPVRKSLYSEAEYVGSIHAQEDWKNLVAYIGEFYGNLGPALSFFSVSFPECRPERLEILSHSNEFAFIYDGEWIDFAKWTCRNLCEIRCYREYPSSRGEAPLEQPARVQGLT